MPKTITVEATIDAPIESVWKYYTEPAHIMRWNNASDDWHTPHATNDLREGGTFMYRMEARDKSSGFDFRGKYAKIEENKLIYYVMEDGRKVTTTFTSHSNGKTQVKVTFDPENENPIEMQRDGWQSILNSFKRYVEAS